MRITSRWRPVERTAQVGGFGTVSDDGYGVSYIVVGEDRGECHQGEDRSMFVCVQGCAFFFSDNVVFNSVLLLKLCLEHNQLERLGHVLG